MNARPAPAAIHLSGAEQNNALAASTQRKASLRLLPVIGVGYGLAYIDRVNISFASLQMNRDLHFSATTYSIGAGLFFIGYALCEVPSNLMMLRYGARKWLTRIMLTWGLLAMAMMFVRTSLQFDVLRLLLGIAEAGFFPGVVFYLTLWFPGSARARAVSRFYIALPLASVVMGSLAGWLLGLGGKFGLSSWQWLFLLEGLPAALFSIVIFKTLPDGPKDVDWLTAEEKAWLAAQLKIDSAEAHLGHGASVLQALLSPKVWLIGTYFLCALTVSYAYSFSAPAILQGVTGWSVTEVGWLIAAFGIAAALGMILNASHSDRTRERKLHCIVPCLVMGIAYACAGLASARWVVVISLAIGFIAFNSMLAPALAVPQQFLAGRAAAAGLAAMNTITMFSGFIGPLWMGIMKDATGSYKTGLVGLLLPSLAAAWIMLLLMRSLRAPRT
jgi:ACS family tartrate transporter-like MFS transporter